MRNILLVGLLAGALAQSAQAQGSGAIAGAVRDAQNRPLPGATVALEGSRMRSITGDNGRFLLRGVPAGSQRLTVSYLGYADGTADVTVVEGETAEANLHLEVRPITLQGIEAFGRIGQGQAKALTQQKNAASVKSIVSYELFDRFPDRNGAEAIQRIPGVTIDRDQGEGEHASVRGLPPEWNSVTVNGQRIPALVAGRGREVGLDLVQAELFDAIEVTKGLTPDMDADALGGSINFVPRRAPDAPLLTLQGNYGLNEQHSRFREWGRAVNQFFGVGGTRLGEADKLGVLGAISFYDTNRGSLLKEYTLQGTTENITRTRANDYDVNRQRLGVQATADYRFAPGNEINISGAFNSFRDDEIRRRAQFSPANGTEDREIRNRLEDQTYAWSQLNGQATLGRSATLRYRGSWSRTEEDIPDRTLIAFRRTNTEVLGLPNDQVRALNEASTFPSQAALPLRQVSAQFANTVANAWTGGADVAIPFALGSRAAVLTLGGKYTTHKRDESRHTFTASPAAPDTRLLLSDSTWPYIDGWRVLRDDLDGARQRFRLNPFVEDAETSATSFAASENVGAGFVMLANEWSRTISTVAGVRIENTAVDYQQVATGNRGKGGYADVLPSVHATFRPRDDINVRFGLSTGLARPNFAVLVPIVNVDSAELTIVRGNSDLEATRSKAVDLAIERYDDRLGLLGAAFFYKNITNVITTAVGQEVIGVDTYEVSQPINGETASLWGIELTVSQRLAALGLPSLRDFGVLGSYTYTDSKTDIGGRELDLPNAARHSWNAALFYDNPRFGYSASLAANQRSAILIGVGASAAQDHYFNSEFHLDFSMTQRLPRNATMFLKVNNITDQDEQEIFGEPYDNRIRLHQVEQYGRTATLGLRLDFGAPR
jgi:TonB-dependent receptor